MTSKTSVLKTIFACCCLHFFMVSCSKDDLPTEPELQQQEIETIATPETSRTSCDYNLTHDGCNFTSGEGKPLGSYNTMITLLNNCRTESLASNCNWFGNYMQTAVIERTFNNVFCEDPSRMNFYLNYFEGLAKSNRPSKSFIITGYELVSTQTWSGKFKLKIRVFYRKQICSLSGGGSGISFG